MPNIIDRYMMLCGCFDARAEIQRVDQHLDSLDSVLDAIERKNDAIHAQLMELLQSNREIRTALQEEAKAANPVAKDQPPAASSTSAESEAAVDKKPNSNEQMDEE